MVVGVGLEPTVCHRPFVLISAFVQFLPVILVSFEAYSRLVFHTLEYDTTYNQVEGYVVIDGDFGEPMSSKTGDESVGPLVEAGEKYLGRDYVSTPNGFDHGTMVGNRKANDLED
jgi:hypothetical protein